jgi:DNA-binding response OmpR family regulator
LDVQKDKSSVKAKILCLDDEPVGLFVRQVLLEQSGYAVVTATTSEKALQIFAEEQIDFVISDYSLGDTLGTQLAESMKRIKPNVPIMILSGWDQPPEGLGGADIFMCKAEPPSVLLEMIAKLLVRTARKAA